MNVAILSLNTCEGGVAGVFEIDKNQTRLELVGAGLG